MRSRGPRFNRLYVVYRIIIVPRVKFRRNWPLIGVVKKRLWCEGDLFLEKKSRFPPERLNKRKRFCYFVSSRVRFLKPCRDREIYTFIFGTRVQNLTGKLSIRTVCTETRINNTKSLK